MVYKYFLRKIRRDWKSFALALLCRLHFFHFFTIPTVVLGSDLGSDGSGGRIRILEKIIPDQQRCMLAFFVSNFLTHN
jgi:hypothetical protein